MGVNFEFFDGITPPLSVMRNYKTIYFITVSAVLQEAYPKAYGMTRRREFDNFAERWYTEPKCMRDWKAKEYAGTDYPQ